jgi:hypothetical protein
LGKTGNLSDAIFCAACAPSEATVCAGSMPAERTETRKRSVVKAIIYRVVVVCLDFLAIYIFTHKVEVALGFMIVSSIGRLLLA